VKLGSVRIGTSGWHYKHWCGTFYDEKLPASKMLAEYLRHFDTVEINNSFYRLPTEDAFRCWRESTPKNFLFAVKGSRFITHMKKLKDPENALENLIPRAEELKEKLGPILWQLPPKWAINTERLEEFLAALPKNHRYAIEFRELSWHTEQVYAILKKHNAAFCIFELAGHHSPLEVTANWTYVRLHGPGGRYQGSYSTEKLREWVRWIDEQRFAGRDVFVYFDNDQAGYAAHNALELKRLLAASEASLRKVA
jgi:uncharacterized protein YecE (DUF72 family)